MSRRTVRRIGNGFFAFAIGLLAFLAAIPVFAQSEPPPADTLALIVTAVQLHHWLVVAGLALGTIVAAAVTHRVGVQRVVPWFGTDAGGTVWTFLLAGLGSIATTLTAGQPIGLATLSAAVSIGVVAIGGYTGLRKLLSKSGGLGARWPVLATFADALGPKQVAQG